MRRLYYTILIIKYIPFINYLLGNGNKVIVEEQKMYLKNTNCPYSGVLSFVWLMECLPEYRNLFFYRNIGLYWKILSKLYKGQIALYLQIKKNIGKNFMIWHGFSTIINADSIGDNCEIWQQVTIGNKFNIDGPKPQIGNNVKICAGAIVIGDVKIGDYSIIGAGAVVTKDVPANSVVVGVPAKVISHTN